MIYFNAAIMHVGSTRGLREKNRESFLSSRRGEIYREAWDECAGKFDARS